MRSLLLFVLLAVISTAFVNDAPRAVAAIGANGGFAAPRHEVRAEDVFVLQQPPAQESSTADVSASNPSLGS